MVTIAEGSAVSPRRLLGAMRWNAGGIALQAFIQLGFTILLARLLGPTPFGLMALGWAVATPALIFADAGLGSTLVQREHVSDGEVAGFFWAHLATSGAVAVLFAAAAPMLAGLLDSPELRPVLLAFAAMIVLQGAGWPALNMLRRTGDFRALQLLQLAAFLLSYAAIGAPLALSGAGVWSLAAAMLGNVAFQGIGAYVIVRHPIRPRSRAPIWQFRALSVQFLALNLINNVVFGSAPRIVMGRFFGMDILGLFDRAMALLVGPAERAAAAVETVLFTSHARLIRRGLDRDLLLTSLTGALLVALPGAVVVALNGALFIELAFGAAWRGAAVFVPSLSVLIPLLFVIQILVPALNGRGRPGLEVVVQTAGGLFFFGTVAFVDLAAPTVIWVLAAACALRVVALGVCVVVLSQIRIASLVTAVLPGLLLAPLFALPNALTALPMLAGAPPALRAAGIVSVTAAMAIATWSLYWRYCRPSYARRLLADS